MKTYTFKVILREGYDEFWESIEGKPGKRKVQTMLEDCLQQYFSVGKNEDCEVSLERLEE